MPAFYALLVGINDYPPGTAVPVLRGCTADILAVREHLLRLTGAPPANLVTLLNEQGTRPAFLAAWQALAARVQSGDLFYVHYSGHGSTARSADPNESDGFDETLVLWDSRLPNGQDLRDKELARLIHSVEARGAQVVLFLDSCNSGGATRREPAANVRACAPDLRNAPPAPAETTGAPETVALEAIATQRYVLLAASMDEEKAAEYQTPAGWHGAATWFYLRLLEEYHPSFTWSQAHDRIAAGVRAIFAKQTPQLTGPRDLLLFGGQGVDAASYLTVLEVTADGRLRVDAGAALGLVEGSRLAILPRAAQGNEAPLAHAVVDEANAGDAWARIKPGDAASGATAPEILPASRARILSFGQGAPVYGLLAQEPLLISALAGARFVSTANPEVAFVVEAREGSYSVQDPNGEPLVQARPPVSVEGAATVVRLLEHLAIWRNVRTLHNRAVDPALRGAIAVSAPRAVKASRSTLIADGEARALERQGHLWRIQPKERVVFTLTNQSGERLFVTVLLLGADGSIRRILPVNERQATLADEGELRVELKNLLLPAGQIEATLVAKVFVTKDKASFDALQLPALDRGDPLQVEKVRGGDPLAELLNSVRSEGTRPLRFGSGANVDDRWYTEQWEFLLAAPV